MFFLKRIPFYIQPSRFCMAAANCLRRPKYNSEWRCFDPSWSPHTIKISFTRYCVERHIIQNHFCAVLSINQFSFCFTFNKVLVTANLWNDPSTFVWLAQYLSRNVRLFICFFFVHFRDGRLCWCFNLLVVIKYCILKLRLTKNWLARQSALEMLSIDADQNTNE